MDPPAAGGPFRLQVRSMLWPASRRRAVAPSGRLTTGREADRRDREASYPGGSISSGRGPFSAPLSERGNGPLVYRAYLYRFPTTVLLPQVMVKEEVGLY